MRKGSSLAVLGSIGLMLGGIPGIGALRAEPGAIFVPVCGDAIHLIRIPTKDYDNQRDTYPKACHAMCTRRDMTVDAD